MCRCALLRFFHGYEKFANFTVKCVHGHVRVRNSELSYHSGLQWRAHRLCSRPYTHCNNVMANHMWLDLIETVSLCYIELRSCRTKCIRVGHTNCTKKATALLSERYCSTCRFFNKMGSTTAFPPHVLASLTVVLVGILANAQ